MNQKNDFTDRLIKKHFKVGMNVLDVGCGSGDTSFLIAETVGNTGNVDGIDINSTAIDIALKRKKGDRKTKYFFFGL